MNRFSSKIVMTLSALALVLGLHDTIAPSAIFPNPRAEAQQLSIQDRCELEKKRSQERLDKILAHHNYPKQCKMGNEQDEEVAFAYLENAEKVGDKLPKPQELTAIIRSFARPILNTVYTPIGKLKALHRFIHDNYEPDDEHEYLPTEMVRIFSDGKQQGAVKVHKLFGRCDSLHNLFVACTKLIPEIEEAYTYELVRDSDGQDYATKMAASKEGLGHIRAAVKLNGLWIGVDVTAERGFGINCEEMNILNCVEVTGEFMCKDSDDIRTQEGSYYKQIEMLENAVWLNPYDHFARYCLAHHLSATNKVKAFSHILEANRLKPDYFVYLAELAAFYSDFEEFDLALGKIDEVLTSCPNYAEGHNIKHLILRAMGRYKDAKKEIEKAIALCPDETLYEAHLANIAQTMNKTK